MQNIVHTIFKNPDLQEKVKELTKYFDEEFTTLSKISLIQEKVKHDASLFDIVRTNVRNNLKN